MDIVSALGLIVTLTNSATNILAQLGKVSAFVQKAQAENRELTADEWASIIDDNNKARQKFEDDLAKENNAKAA